MLINARAEGLFHRAILQSANVTQQFVHHKVRCLGYKSSEETGATFATEVVGAGAGQLDRLRTMPAAELALRYSEARPAGTGAGSGSDWQG